MRILIVEDDFGSRRLMNALLQPYGRCDVVVDGREAVDAVRLAWEENDPYRLVLLDIMMPNMDGHTALKEMRSYEQSIGVRDEDHVRVIMTTALSDPKTVVTAYHEGGADGYVVKPIDRTRLYETIRAAGIALDR